MRELTYEQELSTIQRCINRIFGLSGTALAEISEEDHPTLEGKIKMLRVEDITLYKDNGEWTMDVATVVPGIRYRRDGTGEPDDVDIDTQNLGTGDWGIACSKACHYLFEHRLEVIGDEALALDYPIGGTIAERYSYD